MDALIADLSAFLPASKLLADPANLLIKALAVALIGGLMRGFAGFGSALMLAPVLAVLLTPAHMVPLVVAIELPIGVMLFLETRRLVVWRFVAPMAAASMLAQPLGIWLLVSIDTRLVTIAVSAIVLAFLFVLVLGWRYHGPRHWWLTVGVGAASGAMMTTTSVGGPPVITYMLAGKDGAAVNRANIVAYFLITGTMALVMLLATLPRAGGPLIDAGVMLPAMVLGTWLGARFAGRASEKVYRMIAYLFLAAAALFGLLG